MEQEKEKINAYTRLSHYENAGIWEVLLSSTYSSCLTLKLCNYLEYDKA
ncbi:MAG: hypothetical protein FWD52_02145 [Candidatus Bathyarchaeota archaeon]|nr:hypothetical protein [Candidatus Termiticorpusculum sp.]